MNIFLVGGAVRDKLLGYPFHERDWVVVGSSPEHMLKEGYTQVGKDFPVFLHPDTKEEYALARTERKSGTGYTGFSFYAGKETTLEEDLARRDLTINAIAETEDGQIVDPYHGQADIKNKILRHVTDAFAEDPVRILRVARFMARYHHLGFSIAPETLELMQSIVESGEVDHLVPERVWQEFHKALSEPSPEQFVITLKECNALKIIMPEIEALFGVPQPELYHPEVDTGLHTILTLQQASKLCEKPLVRFGSLMHDLGKGLTSPEDYPSHKAHEKRGVKVVRTLCKRLKVPSQYRELAELVCEFHTHCHRALQLRAGTMLELFNHLDAFRRPERFYDFVVCCQADSQGRTGLQDKPYLQRDFIEKAFQSAQTIKAKDFLDQGFSGRELGQKINQGRIDKIQELKRAYDE